MNINLVSKGVKFGMILQVAVGPLCLFIFNTSTKYGLLQALSSVLAIALVDAVYVFLSCVGIASVIKKGHIQAIIKWIGCFVLVLFGVSTILSVFDISLLPKAAVDTSGHSLWLQGMLLTASNPLTIVYWGGVLSTQVAEHDWNKKQLFCFGCGCVTATLLFLSGLSLLGSILSSFLPWLAISLINGTVGVFLIYYGIKILSKKEDAPKEERKQATFKSNSYPLPNRIKKEFTHAIHTFR